MRKSGFRAFVLACVFGLARASADAAPCAGFTDVEDTSSFCPNVTWLKNRLITIGCTATQYCPGEPVNRLAMAAFMNRLGNYLPPTFVDANGKAFGTYLSGLWFSDYVFTALLRYQGSVATISMSRPEWAPRFRYASVPAYFELPDCSFSGKVWIQISWNDGPFAPRHAAVVFGGPVGAPGPRWLYLSVPFAAPRSQSYASEYADGICTNGANTGLDLVEAERAVDLVTVWTEPFTIQ